MALNSPHRLVVTPQADPFHIVPGLICVTQRMCRWDVWEVISNIRLLKMASSQGSLSQTTHSGENQLLGHEDSQAA